MPDLISILDLIRKQSAINALVEEANQDGAYGYVDAKSIVDILTGLPTVDAAEVVRCKDYKWCSHFTDGHIECRLLYDLKPVPRTYMQMREDDYCSYGEKVME